MPNNKMFAALGDEFEDFELGLNVPTAEDIHNASQSRSLRSLSNFYASVTSPGRASVASSINSAPESGVGRSQRSRLSSFEVIRNSLTRSSLSSLSRTPSLSFSGENTPLATQVDSVEIEIEHAETGQATEALSRRNQFEEAADSLSCITHLQQGVTRGCRHHLDTGLVDKSPQQSYRRGSIRLPPLSTELSQDDEKSQSGPRIRKFSVLPINVLSEEGNSFSTQKSNHSAQLQAQASLSLARFCHSFPPNLLGLHFKRVTDATMNVPDAAVAFTSFPVTVSLSRWPARTVCGIISLVMLFMGAKDVKHYLETKHLSFHLAPSQQVRIHPVSCSNGHSVGDLSEPWVGCGLTQRKVMVPPQYLNVVQDGPDCVTGLSASLEGGVAWNGIWFSFPVESPCHVEDYEVHVRNSSFAPWSLLVTDHTSKESARSVTIGEQVFLSQDLEPHPRVLLSAAFDLSLGVGYLLVIVFSLLERPDLSKNCLTMTLATAVLSILFHIEVNLALGYQLITWAIVLNAVSHTFLVYCVHVERGFTLAVAIIGATWIVYWITCQFDMKSPSDLFQAAIIGVALGGVPLCFSLFIWIARVRARIVSTYLIACDKETFTQVWDLTMQEQEQDVKQLCQTVQDLSVSGLNKDAKKTVRQLNRKVGVEESAPWYLSKSFASSPSADPQQIDPTSRITSEELGICQNGFRSASSLFVPSVWRFLSSSSSSRRSGGKPNCFPRQPEDNMSKGKIPMNTTISGQFGLLELPGVLVEGTRDSQRPIRNLDQLFFQAYAVQPILRERVFAWAFQSGGMLQHVGGATPLILCSHSLEDPECQIKWTKIKSPGRAMEKMVRSYDKDPSRLLDICRESIIFETVSGINRCLQAISADPSVIIERIKNRMDPKYDAGARGGYRDVMINVRIVNEETRQLCVEGHIAEVQLLYYLRHSTRIHSLVHTEFPLRLHLLRSAAPPSHQMPRQSQSSPISSLSPAQPPPLSSPPHEHRFPFHNPFTAYLEFFNAP